jgi:hypothetical protein
MEVTSSLHSIYALWSSRPGAMGAGKFSQALQPQDWRRLSADISAKGERLYELVVTPLPGK